MEHVEPFGRGEAGRNARLPKLLRSSIILAMIILLVNLGIILFVHEAFLKVVLLQLPYPLWDLLAALALLYAAKRSAQHSRRLLLAWGLLAAARLLLCLGETRPSYPPNYVSLLVRPPAHRTFTTRPRLPIWPSWGC